jgi:hypothetical protein
MAETDRFLTFYNSFLSAPEAYELDLVRANRRLVQTLGFIDWVGWIAEAAATDPDLRRMKPSIVYFLGKLHGFLPGLAAEDPVWDSVGAGVANGLGLLSGAAAPFEFRCALFLERWVLAGVGTEVTLFEDECEYLVEENRPLLADSRFVAWLTDKVMDLALAPEDLPKRNLHVQGIALLASYLSAASQSDPGLKPAASASELIRQLATQFNNAFRGRTHRVRRRPGRSRRAEPYRTRRQGSLGVAWKSPEQACRHGSAVGCGRHGRAAGKNAACARQVAPILEVGGQP